MCLLCLFFGSHASSSPQLGSRKAGYACNYCCSECRTSRSSGCAVSCVKSSEYVRQPNFAPAGGDDLEAKNKFGHCPLHEAVLAQSLACVQILLGANVHVDSLKHGMDAILKTPNRHNHFCSRLDESASCLHETVGRNSLRARRRRGFSAFTQQRRSVLSCDSMAQVLPQ
jgi:hypothetical protein